MTWIDKGTVNTILKLKNAFNIDTFVETSGLNGVSADLFSRHFKEVFTIEEDKKRYNKLCERISNKLNVTPINKSPSSFLHEFHKEYFLDDRDDIVFFYLNRYPASNNEFPVLNELKSLAGFNPCIICIDGFDNNLGHIAYNKQSLDMKLIGNDLFFVNPTFRLYTNQLKNCRIIKSPVEMNFSENDTDAWNELNYSLLLPETKYRGVLYALPKILDKPEKFNIREVTRWI